MKTWFFGIDKPFICPHCNAGIDPRILNHFLFKKGNQQLLCVSFQCPICSDIFFALYGADDLHMYIVGESNAGPKRPLSIIGEGSLKKEFSKEINKISPAFPIIYNDAFKAEQQNCDSIIGIGYRLAFERLIKDYCIWIHPDKKDEILSMTLSACINEFFDDEYCKELCRKTAWLGNDFSHCYSKHPEFNVSDLKELIDICASEIEKKVRGKGYISRIDKK